MSGRAVGIDLAAGVIPATAGAAIAAYFEAFRWSFLSHPAWHGAAQNTALALTPVVAASLTVFVRKSSAAVVNRWLVISVALLAICVALCITAYAYLSEPHHPSSVARVTLGWQVIFCALLLAFAATLTLASLRLKKRA